METHSVTRKRPKQACKNCRRKKARCPGERPVCSFCDRLKQICEYDDLPVHREQPRASGGSAKASKLADRVAQLESKLSVLTNTNLDTPAVSPTGQRRSFDSPLTADKEEAAWSRSALLEQARQGSSISASEYHSSSKFRVTPPDYIIRAAIDLYFAICHSRPCTFFYEYNFREQFQNEKIPTYLLLAIVATTARLSYDPWFEGSQVEASRVVADHAWTLVLSEVLPTEETTTLAATQAVGLLALLDYRAGSYQSANMKLRIAISMAQSLRLTSEHCGIVPATLQEEQRYVVWTLYVIDKVAALSFDSSYALSDQECMLKLPEDEHIFQKTLQNGMPDLATVKAHSILLTSAYAKLVLAASVIGSLVVLCHGGNTSSSHSSSHVDSTYMLLATKAKQLADVLGIDTLGSASNSATKNAKNKLNEEQESVQALYARALYHLIQVFINHPFFTRREIKLADSPRSQAFLHRSLTECREHAQMLTQYVAKSQENNAVPHFQLVPGYIIFNAAIVHCMFTNSRNRNIASTSRELYEISRNTLLQQALADNNPRLQSYLAVLEFFLRNPGVSDLLVDPTLTGFRHPSTSSSYWRVLDFDWLCEQFCLDTTEEPASEQRLPPRQSLSRLNSVVTTSSDSTSGGPSCSPSTPITPESTLNTAQHVQSPGSPLKESMLTDAPRPDINRQSGQLAFGSIAQTLSLDESEKRLSAESMVLDDLPDVGVNATGTFAGHPMQHIKTEQVAASLNYHDPRAGPTWEDGSPLFTFFRGYT